MNALQLHEQEMPFSTSKIFLVVSCPLKVGKRTFSGHVNTKKIQLSESPLPHFLYSRHTVKWYEAAAQRAHPQAVCTLGFCYAKGHGVEKNEVIPVW